jgi:acyl-CoA synthetase (AMP-forming)/AMP-acid ligase II
LILAKKKPKWTNREDLWINDPILLPKYFVILPPDPQITYYLLPTTYYLHTQQGEMPEWSNGAVSKTVDLFTGIRGFESLSLRKLKMLLRSGIFSTPDFRYSCLRIPNPSPMLLHQFIEKPVKETPDKIAVVCQGNQCTYQELYDAMNQFSQALLSLGVREGDRVALFMKNRIELVQLYYACFQIGAIAVPVNTRYTTPEAEYALGQSGSKVLICDSNLYQVAEPIGKTMKTLEHLFVLDDKEKHTDASWQNVVDGIREEKPMPEVHLEDPVVIIYTSGSTGKPKGAVHTHYSMFHQIENKTNTMELQSDEIGLAGTQISHIAGFAGLMLPILSNGGTLVLEREFDAGDYILCLKTRPITNLLLLPTELLDVLEHPKADDADFSHIRNMMIAGDKVPHHVYELFHKQAGYDLMEGCGMTECEGYCLQPKHAPKKPGSIGKPVSGVSMRLVNAEMKDVPQGEQGEILVKAKSVIKEYWNNPEATAKTFVDGWLRTGDVAYQDQDGYYFFVSRIKEIIIRGGSNIMPGEIEDVLDDHPAVEISGVVGFPDVHWGQIVGVFVVPKDQKNPPTEQELIDFAGKRLAKYKIPEKWILTDHIPINAVGKIDRKKLHEMSLQIGS